jgi:hypothetical protein
VASLRLNANGSQNSGGRIQGASDRCPQKCSLGSSRRDPRILIRAEDFIPRAAVNAHAHPPRNQPLCPAAHPMYFPGRRNRKWPNNGPKPGLGFREAMDRASKKCVRQGRLSSQLERRWNHTTSLKFQAPSRGSVLLLVPMWR